MVTFRILKLYENVGRTNESSARKICQKNESLMDLSIFII